MSVLKKDIEYIADLSRIYFTEEEKEDLIHDFNNLLNCMDKLNEVNTDDVDILVNPYYIENKFREDEIQKSMPEEDVFMNAPDRLEEYVKVPKIIE